MTDIAAYPNAFAPGGISRFRRFVSLLARSFERAMIADDTRRALNELPDNVLRDLGIARRDIPFAAGPLASSNPGFSRQDGVGRLSIRLRAGDRSGMTPRFGRR
jgi:uncharacterized protein YjiS (DUF1127 family)